MQRRKLLKAVAAGGLASVASTATAGAKNHRQIDELDALHVVEGADDEVVTTVEA